MNDTRIDVVNDAPSSNPENPLDQRTEEERAEAARIAAQTTEEWLAEYDAAFVYGDQARQLTPKQEGHK